MKLPTFGRCQPERMARVPESWDRAAPEQDSTERATGETGFLDRVVLEPVSTGPATRLTESSDRVTPESESTERASQARAFVALAMPSQASRGARAAGRASPARRTRGSASWGTAHRPRADPSQAPLWRNST